MGTQAAVIAGTLALGVVVPWAFMRMLAPALSASEAARGVNFRGREVFLGLGIVWLVWSGCAIVGGVLAGSFLGDTLLPVLTIAGPLALVAFALGMVDDALGSGADRGFRGHFSALAGGRMTTGMLKLVGMGVASLVVGAVASEFAPWGGLDVEFGASVLPAYASLAALVLIASMSIALTANFVNLTDLRPGRALKVYALLVVLGVAVFVATMTVRNGYATPTPANRILEACALAAFLLGPVAAVWRYDLGELGMLGDAGANPMGAIAGLMIVIGLPWWGLIGYFVVILALNLASERVSFSRVIEATPPLRWLDSLGRLPDEPTHDDSSKSSPESEPQRG